LNRNLTQMLCAAAAGIALAASELAGTGAAGAARAGSAGPGTAVPVHSILHGVTATSARNAWAVGLTVAEKTLILRWNGTAWKRVPSPGGLGLLGVAATSARNAWAVGYAGSPSDPGG